MKQSFRLFTLVGALAIAIFTAGCPSSSVTTPKEDAWITQFKKQIAGTEKRFFESNYVLNQEDPFYLNEILSRLQPGKPVTQAMIEKIQTLRDDYRDSWPLLTTQLQRTQAIFAVTAVVPAIEVNLVSYGNSFFFADQEIVDLVAKFRAAVEKGTVFNSRPGKWSPDGDTVILDFSPETRVEVAELADKITARTLTLVGANPSKADLKSKRAIIALLNPRVTASVGQTTTIENPLTLWAELQKTYDAIFAALNAGTKPIVNLQSEIEKLQPGKKRRALEAQMPVVSAGLVPQLAAITELRKRETELLKKLLFATETQFATAKAVAGQK